MALTITEVHRREDDKQLNDEWLLVENPGEAAVSTRGCRVMFYKKGSRKGTEVAKLDPGFNVPPGGKVRVVCGNAGTKAHGKAPDDGVENYYLLMKVPLLRGKAGKVRITKGQLVLAEAELGG